MITAIAEQMENEGHGLQNNHSEDLQHLNTQMNRNSSAAAQEELQQSSEAAAIADDA